MRQLWAGIRDSHHTALQVSAGLALVCLLATLALAVRALSSASDLQSRLDRSYALSAAEQQLLPGLASGDAPRVESALAALLRQPEFAFRYLAVRDGSGSVLAADGLHESLNRRSDLPESWRRWLRATLYTAFGETGELTLREGSRTLGAVEYAIGSPNARLVRDEAVDRLRTTGFVGAVLALGFGVALVLLLRATLAQPTLPAARLRTPRGENGAKPKTAESASGSSTAAFEELAIAVIDVDAELRVLGLNRTAVALTGWSEADAVGQLVYTVFHARDDSGAPIQSPAERCLREAHEQPAQELRLRPRGGSGRDAMVEARAIRRNGGARMLFQDIGGRVASREALRAEARVAQGVIDQLLEAVLTTDPAGVVKTANARALRMFGYGAEEMLRMTVARLLPVPFMNTPGLKLTDYMPGGQTRLPKLAGWRKDATTFPAELTVEPMRALDEERLVVIIRDITEQLRSQSLAQRLGRLLDSASEEVYIFDAQSLYFIEVNKGARRNLGLKPDQLARMSLASIATDLEPAMLQSYLARLRGGEAEHVSYKTSHKRSDGSTYPVEVRLSFSRDEEPPVFMAIALDITEREAAEKRMRQLAHYDGLTNLPNRALLFDRLKQAMLVAQRTGRQLAVLFMDLDGFKPVNDAYGHEAGDLVLQAVADRLNGGLRAADTVARFGGDEFVVLAHGQRDTDDTMMLAAKVHDLFKPAFDVRGQKMHLSTSIGITLYPADPADAEGLLRHADAAMYQAKQKGQGCTHLHVLADPGAKPRAHRGDLAAEINAGLTTRQFQLQFWPVLGAGGLVAAAVADFYWMHPEYGRVESREALGAARRAGLNAAIEAWMLDECAAQHRQGQQQGLPALPVIVALSARQWRDPEFPERLLKLMDRASASMKMLIPLIDGSDWPEAASAVQMLWSSLFQRGLRLAVSQPPPDASMEGVGLVVMPHAGERALEGELARAQLRRFAKLELPLLVEGVATPAEWERLRSQGASHGTGPGLQAPLTPLEYSGWIAARGARPL